MLRQFSNSLLSYLMLRQFSNSLLSYLMLRQFSNSLLSYLLRWIQLEISNPPLTIAERPPSARLTGSWPFKTQKSQFLPCKYNKYYTFVQYVCGLSCPACNALASYCRLQSVRLYGILQRHFMNCGISEDKLLNVNVCFDFLYNVYMQYFPF